MFITVVTVTATECILASSTSMLTAVCHWDLKKNYCICFHSCQLLWSRYFEIRKRIWNSFICTKIYIKLQTFRHYKCYLQTWNIKPVSNQINSIMIFPICWPNESLKTNRLLHPAVLYECFTFFVPNCITSNAHIWSIWQVTSFHLKKFRRL